MEVGRIGRPHGLDGSFYVTRAEPGVLTVGAVVLAGGRALGVERRAGTDARPIIRLAGCGTRDAAEALRGTPLLMPREALPPLEAGEFWAHELAGCAVVDGERAVGEVVRLAGLPSVDVLEVVRPGGSVLLVPLVSDAVRSIDVAGRRIDVDLDFLGEA